MKVRSRLSGRRSWAIVGTVAALMLSTRAAGAFERQWHLGGGVGAGGFFDGETMFTAPVFGAHAGYGVSDMFDVVLELQASGHDVSTGGMEMGMMGMGMGGGGRSWVYSAAAGATYKLDVLSWVPYFGVLAGVYYFDGPTPVGTDVDFGASFTLGLDYAVTRHFGLGGQFRFHFFRNDFPTSLDESPMLTTLLRAEYRWGY